MLVLEFESALACGRFMIPECTGCLKTVWPPSEFCNRCLSSVTLQRDLVGTVKGRILDFSARVAGSFFCLVEFENAVRLVANLSSDVTPEPGDLILLKSCSINTYDDSYVFEVERLV